MNGSVEEINENGPKTKKKLYKSVCVRQLERGIYIPKTIPQERGNKTVIINLIISSVLLLVSIWAVESDLPLTVIISVFLSTLPYFLILPELIYRITAAVEEYSHLITRYDKDMTKLLRQYVFCFSLSFMTLFIISLFFSLIIYLVYKQPPWVLWYNCGILSVICSLLSVLVFERALKFRSAPLYDSLWIATNNGLDYGSGMAHSFFHGYLKIVLPEKGTEEKGLEELMQIYEAKHGVKLETYKLFMLIPKSMYCPVSVRSASSPTVEDGPSLGKIIKTVAGVQNRVYKNSIYKIQDDKGKRHYVAVEYATPLKTFRNVIESNGQHSDYYRQHQNEIVLQFYLTLQKILNENEDCKQLCELIYFDDKDEDGNFYDIGKIILRRLKDINKAK